MSRAVTLVLTHPFDPTADYVVSELNRRGAPVFRCDPGEFPQRLSVAARLDGTGVGWVGSLRLPEREVSLCDIGCAYYRRPTVFDFPAGMGEQVRRWAAGEARIGLGGVLSALPRWLNHPAAIAAAEYKPVQLAHAQACGLSVPDTIVTNDPDEAAKFVTRAGRAVYKPLTPAGITEADTHRVVFTTPVTVGDVDESVRLTAHLGRRRRVGSSRFRHDRRASTARGHLAVVRAGHRPATLTACRRRLLGLRRADHTDCGAARRPAAVARGGAAARAVVRHWHPPPAVRADRD